MMQSQYYFLFALFTIIRLVTKDAMFNLREENVQNFYTSESISRKMKQGVTSQI